MMIYKHYVIKSLELHMYFGRIMKEHSIFLEAGFTPANPDLCRTAKKYKEQFETLLYNAVTLGNGIIKPSILESGELVTDYTLGCEEKTQAFTGIKINQKITKMQDHLYGSLNPDITSETMDFVHDLNINAISALDGLIQFKKSILNDVLSCQIFTAHYPLLIDHILREAKLYRRMLSSFENLEIPDEHDMEVELFWDRIMMEHAFFIRGLLDPTEYDLIGTSNDYARDYKELLQKSRTADESMLVSITGETLSLTKNFKEFKEAATEGIAECKIRSIILPLLADHVLREANHFIRLLE